MRIGDIRALKKEGLRPYAIATAVLLKTGDIKKTVSLLERAGFKIEWTIKIRWQKPADLDDLIHRVNTKMETIDEVEGTMLVNGEAVDVAFVINACASLGKTARAWNRRGELVDIFFAVVDRTEHGYDKDDYVIVAARDHAEARALAAENAGTDSVDPIKALLVLRWHGWIQPRVLLSQKVIGRYSNHPDDDLSVRENVWVEVVNQPGEAVE